MARIVPTVITVSIVALTGCIDLVSPAQPTAAGAVGANGVPISSVGPVITIDVNQGQHQTVQDCTGCGTEPVGGPPPGPPPGDMVSIGVLLPELADDATVLPVDAAHPSLSCWLEPQGATIQAGTLLVPPTVFVPIIEDVCSAGSCASLECRPPLGVDPS